MKTIAAAKFKAHCLTLMDGAHKNREPIVITKRGKPVAKLVPAGNEDREFLGRPEGIIRIVGDIESPLDTTNKHAQQPSRNTPAPNA
ncbi:MAG TPA: type II toxin-antitoxin system Phd/YefM family antitoxin [Candidatus Polarisedimenticolia bacterium]|nr:type II toxin-antitoxin system Phd/YefM family antitoxin [Candidatus Polarisedimenticolia bacterium]